LTINPTQANLELGNSRAWLAGTDRTDHRKDIGEVIREGVSKPEPC